MPLFGTRGAASVTGFGGLAKLGYLLRNSLRFRASNTNYLSRTGGTSTSRRIHTFSFWTKSSVIGGTRTVISAGPDDSNREIIFIDSNKFTYQVKDSNNFYDLESTQVFRDPAAWYHFVVAVDTTQATNTNRVKIYVNGSQITAFGTAVYPLQNDDLFFNDSNGSVSYIGALRGYVNSTYAYDGYMTEFNFIDGQALTPSSFGKTDGATGQWIPIKFGGAYGTNGFYLNFTDASAATAAAIGKDSSGNGNNWTPSGISVTAGATYDSMTDVPTLTSATAANYATLNPLAVDADVTLSNGNLNFSCTSAGLGGTIGTIAVTSGKWYWEVTPTSGPTGFALGIAKLPLSAYDANQTGTYLYLNGGNKRLSPSTDSAYGASYTDNDVIGVALDMDAGTVTFYKNNASQGTAFSSLSGEFTAWVQDGSNGVASVANINFGQQPFQYSAPSGYKALNTYNLP